MFILTTVSLQEPLKETLRKIPWVGIRSKITQYNLPPEIPQATVEQSGNIAFSKEPQIFIPYSAQTVLINTPKEYYSNSFIETWLGEYGNALSSKLQLQPEHYRVKTELTSFKDSQYHYPEVFNPNVILTWKDKTGATHTFREGGALGLNDTEPTQDVIDLLKAHIAIAKLYVGES